MRDTVQGVSEPSLYIQDVRHKLSIHASIVANMSTAIWTDLSRNLTPEDLKIIEGTSTSWLSLDQGIATILVAALDPKLAEANTEVLLSDCKFEEVSDTAKDPSIAERLWKLSESLTKSSAKI
jgi:hypothetical protein